VNYRDPDDIELLPRSPAPRLGRARPWRTVWAATAAVAVVVSVGVVVVMAHAVRHPAPVVPQSRTSATYLPGRAAVSPGPGQPLTAAAAAKRWAAFPVTRNPRPVILVAPDVDGPAGGFPDGDSKLAFVTGHLALAAALPPTPRGQGGYPIRPAADAIAELTADRVTGPGPVTRLPITLIRLTEHGFGTDRGTPARPAWEIHLRGVRDAVYVLAIAAAGRYPAETSASTDTGGYGAPATVSADGRSVTIWFTARHVSTGPCDTGYTTSLDTAQTRTAVALAVSTRFDPPAPTSTPVACPAIGFVHVGPPTPGAPGTRTVVLDQPLGARALVDAYAQPYDVQ